MDCVPNMYSTNKHWAHSGEQRTSLILGSSSTSKILEVLLSPGFKRLAVSLNTTFSPTVKLLIEFYRVFIYISLALSLSVGVCLSILTETIPHNHNSPTHNLPSTSPVLVQALNNLHSKYYVNLLASFPLFHFQSPVLDHIMSNTNWIVALSYSRIFTGSPFLTLSCIKYKLDQTFKAVFTHLVQSLISLLQSHSATSFVPLLMFSSRT